MKNPGDYASPGTSGFCDEVGDGDGGDGDGDGEFDVSLLSSCSLPALASLSPCSLPALASLSPCSLPALSLLSPLLREDTNRT